MKSFGFEVQTMLTPCTKEIFIMIMNLLVNI